MIYTQHTWFVPRTAVLSSGYQVYTHFLCPLHHVLWRTPLLWLWEWGTGLWEFVSPAGIQLIPVVSLPRGWDDGMLQHCLTLMECSGCTIEFRLQL